MRLPQHPIRIGSQVVSRDGADSLTDEVVAIGPGLATVEVVRDADGAYVAQGEHPVGKRERLPLDSLVVVTDFGEPALPGFRSLGAVERGGDKPYHVVINGENHHTLEALRFTPRRRSRPAGTARAPRSFTRSDRRSTRRTSPRSSAAWSASHWRTASPPTTPSTRLPLSMSQRTRAHTTDE